MQIGMAAAAIRLQFRVHACYDGYIRTGAREMISSCQEA